VLYLGDAGVVQW